MRVISNGRFAAQPTHRIDESVAVKADRVAALAARTRTDTFEAAPSSSSSSPLGRSNTVGVTPTGVVSGAPPIPGRTGVSELNPFDANTLPSKGRGGGVLAELDASKAMGAAPMGLDQAARSAAIKTEVESGIGHRTGPDGSPAAADIGVEIFGADPVKVVEGADFSGVTGSMIAAGSVAAGSTAGVAVIAGAFSGGVGLAAVGTAALKTGVTAAVVAGTTKVVEETWASYQREKKKNEERDKNKSKSTPPTPQTPPGGVPPEKAPPPPPPPPPAGETPPPEGKKADETPPPPPPPPPPEDKDAGSTFDPLRGSRGSYEANRDAYLGHADGTPVGARGTSVMTGAADARRTNPGRDGEQDAPTSEALRNVGAELTLTSETRARNDARAATLGNMSRVSGRVTITDGSSDEDDNGGSGRPKGNGLVR